MPIVGFEPTSTGGNPFRSNRLSYTGTHNQQNPFKYSETPFLHLITRTPRPSPGAAFALNSWASAVPCRKVLLSEYH